MSDRALGNGILGVNILEIAQAEAARGIALR